MKITIILGTMIHGGAHRVACIQANELAARGYSVTLLLVVGSLQFPYEISPQVNVVKALPAENLEFSNIKSKIKRKLLAPFYLIKKLKGLKPDLVISHIQGTNREAILSCKYLNIPIIACEHTTHLLPYGWRGKLAYIERRFVYKMADRITLLTTSDKRDFYDRFLLNCDVMPNPCPFTSELLVNQYARKRNILALGDLNRIHIKGWDNLIIIFSQLAKDFPEWTLEFAGNGDEGKNIIKEIAKDKGVLNQVKFLGSVIDVKSKLQESSIFILTSRNEGFSMALLEAMSQGCASIAYDCKSGPGDLIENNVDGFLIEDQNHQQMILKLKKLLENIETRNLFSTRAVESSKQFSKKIIFDKWEAVIKQVISDRELA